MTGLDPRALDAWLFEHVPGFRDLRSIEKLGGGQSNPTYKLVAASGSYALRTQPPGELLPSAHAVDREFKVMSALAVTAVPVPRMLALADDPAASPIGRKMFVMELLGGRTFDDPALPDLQPEQRTAVFDRMNETLAALHGIEPGEVGLASYGRGEGYFARQLAIWQRQYAASLTEPIEEMDRLSEWLDGNLPPDGRAVSIVHGDWRLDNLMFARTGPEVIAVLDWELSTLGDPMADLAYQVMAWRLPQDGLFHGLAGLDRAALGLPTDDEYIDAYCARRRIERPDWFEAAVAHAAFRFAAILQGVFKRSLQGNASDPQRARRLGRAVPSVARVGLDAAGIA